MRSRLMPEQIEEAKRLRALDPRFYTYLFLGQLLGVSGEVVHRAIDQEWAEQKRKESRLARRVRAGKEPPRYKLIEAIRVSEEEFRQRRREIPEDTRDLTGRFFGDPLPGRSALNSRHAH